MAELAAEAEIQQLWKGSQHPGDEKMGEGEAAMDHTILAAATPAKFQRTKGKGRPGKGGQTTGEPKSAPQAVLARWPSISRSTPCPHSYWKRTGAGWCSWRRAQ